MPMKLLSRTVALLASGSITISLCLFRLLLRKWRAQRFTQGDYWIVLALVFIPVDLAALFYMNFRGLRLQRRFSEHRDPTLEEALDDLTPGELRTIITAGRMLILHRVSLCIMMWSLKMAVVDLLRSLTRDIWYYRYLLHCLCALLFGTFVAAFALACLGIRIECTPSDPYWMAHLAYGNCVDNNMWLIAYEVGNITTNALLILLPFPLLLKAGVPARKRLFLGAVLGLATFLVAVNCVRLYRGVILGGRVYTGRYVWSSVELTIAVAVATLPTIYVLLRPSFRGRHGSGSSATKKESREDEGLASALTPPPPPPPLPPPARLVTDNVFGRIGEARIVAYDCASPQLCHLPPTSPALSRRSNSTRRSSMPPLSGGWRVPMSSPNPLAGDTWGTSTWSGGSEFDTCITGGAQARRHSVVVVMDEDQRRRRTSSCINVGFGGCGRILVETEVQQQVEVVRPGGGGGAGGPMGLMGLAAPPPPLARFPHDSLV